MNATEELVREWLKKAENDLKSAQVLLAAEEGLLDTACFHAQQVAEKSLKALLTARGVEFPKTHVLLFLVNLFNDADINLFREKLDRLTDYAVEARYPGDYLEPEREEAEEAVRLAHDIFHLVRSKIAILLEVT
jgi:HEPN domain-containing protein